MAKTTWIARKGKPCPHCGGFQRYNRHWDAYFCRLCDVWTSARCSVTPEKYGSEAAARKECWFECWNRPKYPSGTKE